MARAGIITNDRLVVMAAGVGKGENEKFEPNKGF
jgi:hypothetical protein